jgi:hypothetical protein
MADVVPAQNSQSAQDAHEDLLAALAASRELGPEMDQTLAERFLEKHRTAGAVASRAARGPSGVVARRPNVELAAIGPVLGVVAYIVLVAVSGGSLWWTFFIVPMISGGWWWGGHGWDGPSKDARQARWQQRDNWRQSRRDARDQYRAWRHGYPYAPPSYGPRDDEDQQQASTPSARDARTPSDVV